MAAPKPSSSNDPIEGRCPICWPTLSDPPYQHRTSQKVPTAKADIVEAIIEESEKTLKEDELNCLTVSELRLKLRMMKNVIPHRANPTIGISGCNKSYIISLCNAHGIDVDSTHSVAQLRQCVRQHWDRQCSLAGQMSFGSSQDSKPEPWIVVSESEKSQKPQLSQSEAAPVNSQVSKTLASIISLASKALRGA